MSEEMIQAVQNELDELNAAGALMDPVSASDYTDVIKKAVAQGKEFQDIVDEVIEAYLAKLNAGV